MSKLNLFAPGGKFQLKPGSAPLKAYKGVAIDLTDIEEAAATNLANDPMCKFVQWKDEALRKAVEAKLAKPEATATPENSIKTRLAAAQNVPPANTTTATSAAKEK